MNWNLLTPDPDQAEELSRQLNLPLQVTRLLINRGIKGLDQAREFFSPSLSNLPPPGLMKDMEKAVSRICRAIQEKERLAIFGDYDADGITATALLLQFLKPLAPDSTFYLPHRTREGYGLSLSGISELKEQGVSLIITVDCGISNHHEIAFARQLGLEVIVTDHHQIPRQGPPAALAVINPRQEGCSFPFKELAGVGVALYLVIALRQALDRQGFFAQGKPNLRPYLDLAALGTLADMVPLIGANRILVREGLAEMTKGLRTGLAALKEVSGLQSGEPVSSYDVSFRLAPRINALGRLQSAAAGVELFFSDDREEARRIAQLMQQENTRRQEMEKTILKEIENHFQLQPATASKRSLVFGSATWHRGVLGIVASRLVESWSRPAFVFAIEGELAHGSGRSIEGFHLVKGLEALENLLLKFGGHAAAAGVTLKAKDLPLFEKAFEELAAGSLPETPLRPALSIEGEMDFSDLRREVVPYLPNLAPFGAGNPEPILATRGVRIRDRRLVGNGHLRLRLEQKGVILNGIGFGMGEKEIEPGDLIDLAYIPGVSYRGGDSFLQLRIKDLEPS